MIAFILDKLASWLLKPGRLHEYLHISNYMRRWWILPYTRFGFGVRVHEILTSDMDPHLHDHPWAFITIILRGGYFEQRPYSYDPAMPLRGDLDQYPRRWIRERWHGPGSILFRRHDDWHRLEAHPDAQGPTVTLFITFKYRHQWGFWVEGKKISHVEYNSKKPGLDPRLITLNAGKYKGEA